jgi:DNA repair exonuclease SbcCD nuclease subunit
MRIAIINDTHMGARNDSLAFNAYFFKFWDDVFFPYLKENNITNVLHLGDMVDRRKFVNYVILNHWRKNFIERLKNQNISFDMLVGNHDVPYKNTNDVNALDELFGSYDNIRIFSDPCEIKYDDLTVAFLPWVNSENVDKTLNLIKKTKSQIAFGHLEISGFEMDRGAVCLDGMPKNIFDKFDMVISGHFHHKSTDGRIHYLGTQYEITWADYADQKGFHIFDTDTRELTFVENPYSMFHKITYDDKQENFDFSKINIDSAENSYVKIVVLNKTNPYIFDRFMEKIYNKNPIDISIVESINDLTSDDTNDTIDEAQDTVTILNTYVDNMEMDMNKDRLKKLLRELYIESVNLEQV